MRLTLLAALALVLCGECLPAKAQFFSQVSTGPLSAYEYHDGTYTTLRGVTKSATLRLAMMTDRSGYHKQRYATLVAQTATGYNRPDSVVSFSFENRRFLRLSHLTADLSLREEIDTDFIEAFQDTGRIELYGYYPIRQNRFVLASFTPGTIRESDLTRYFLWRRRGAPGFELMARVSPSGFSPAFERQLRALFADRPDIIKYVDTHDIRREDLPAVVKAYNSGRPLRFE
jgi:hypothetical protein